MLHIQILQTPHLESKINDQKKYDNVYDNDKQRIWWETYDQGQ